MPNTYANLADFKDNLVAGVNVTTFDTRMRELLEAISRVIDEYQLKHAQSPTTANRSSHCILNYAVKSIVWHHT